MESASRFHALTAFALHRPDFMKTSLFPYRVAFLLAFLTSDFSARADGGILIKAGQKVVFLGDSITFQGWQAPGGYIRLVTAGLETLGVKIVPVPAGVGGNTSVDMLARLDRDVLSKKPDWMTLSCGVNDVWHGANGGVPLEAYERNITSIVDQAQAAGIKVVILTSTVIGEELDNENNKKLVAYNDFLHQLAKARNLPIAGENEAFQAAIKATPPSPGAKVLTHDGVHPIPDGNQILAATLLQAMGATPAQMEHVTQAWLDLPSSAGVGDAFCLHTSGPITIRQYNAVKALAKAKKVTVSSFCHVLYLQSVEEVCASRLNKPQGTGNVDGEIEAEAQKIFLKRIADLTR